MRTLWLPVAGHASAERDAAVDASWAPHMRRAQEALLPYAAAAGILLLNPRLIVRAWQLLETRVLGRSPVTVDLASWPYIPSILVPLVICALVVARFDRRTRLATLGIVSVPLAFAYGYVDAPSAAIGIVFTALLYAVIHLPLRRVHAALLAAAFSLVALAGLLRWLPGSAIANAMSVQIAMLPMVWYSVYDHQPPAQRQSPWRLAGYLYLRWFGGPVATPRDIFGTVAPADQQRLQRAGFAAIYVAIAASIVQALAAVILRRIPFATAHGLVLLGVSYASYIEYSCRIIVPFNLVTGILRLYGVPVRDSFTNWVTARTPNEHWQRWNVLLREWVIAFVFFPIMRARRWLFAAIMAGLTVSGLLHVLPLIVAGQGASFPVLVGLGYYMVNGLAIYLVVALPRAYPGVIARLGIDNGLWWSVTGIGLTSTFYAVLHGLRHSASLAEMAGYVDRLTMGPLL